MPPDAETIEHLTQRTSGGTLARDNVALACYKCNTGRGMMDWFTYKSYVMGKIFT